MPVRTEQDGTLSFPIRADRAGALVDAIASGEDARSAALRLGADSSLSETPARDPRRWGHTGAYPRVGRKGLSAPLVKRLYDEVGIYSTIVDTWAEDTWAEGYELQTKNEAWVDSVLEAEADLDVAEAMQEADAWGIQPPGYAGVYYRLEDATETNEEQPRSVRGILGLEVLDATHLSDVRKGKDPEDEATFGQVTHYKVKTTQGEEWVHAERVLLFRERKKAGEDLEGRARMRPVVDDVLLGENVAWAAGESFWQRASPILEARVTPGAKLTPEKATNIKKQIEDLQSSTIQRIVSEGFQLVPLTGGSMLVTPKPYWDLAIDKMAASARIPKHRIIGAAAGAIESAKEDTRFYYARVSRRRSRFAARRVKEHLKKLAAWGLIDPLPDDLKVTFPPLDEPSQLEVFEAEDKRASAIQKFKSANVAPPVDLVDYEPGELELIDDEPEPAAPGAPPAPGQPPALPARAAPPGAPQGAPPTAGQPTQPETRGGHEHAAWPSHIAWSRGADGRSRPVRVWHYADAIDAHGARDALGLEVPELKPHETRARFKLQELMMNREEAYRALFTEDERTGPMAGEPVKGKEALDPDDALLKALLALDFASADIEAVLFDLLMASGTVGGIVTWTALGRAGVFEFIDDTQIRTFRTLARMTAANENHAIVERVRRSLAEGLVMGEGLGQLRARVIDTFEPLYGMAETIARAEAMRGYNVGAREAMRQAGLQEWQFNAFSDACPTCAPLDDTTYSLDDTMNLPPMHPRCRCIATGVVTPA